MSERDSICAVEEKPEDWRPVVGWEREFEVSSEGRVRFVGGREIRQRPQIRGYMTVRLSRPRSTQRVHRLVATAFMQNPDNKPYVNHIDCDPANNRIENLEWCTQAENIAHANRLGRMCKDYWAGKRSPAAILSDEQVREMRRLYAAGGISWESLGKRFGVSKRCAGRVVTMETYINVQ